MRGAAVPARRRVVVQPCLLNFAARLDSLALGRGEEVGGFGLDCWPVFGDQAPGFVGQFGHAAPDIAADEARQQCVPVAHKEPGKDQVLGQQLVAIALRPFLVPVQGDVAGQGDDGHALEVFGGVVVIVRHENITFEQAQPASLCWRPDCDVEYATDDRKSGVVIGDLSAINLHGLTEHRFREFWEHKDSSSRDDASLTPVALEQSLDRPPVDGRILERPGQGALKASGGAATARDHETVRFAILGRARAHFRSIS